MFSGYLESSSAENPDDKFCADIDECAMGVSMCNDPNTVCKNVVGSYTCDCSVRVIYFHHNSDSILNGISHLI